MSIGTIIKNNLMKSPKKKIRIGKPYDGGYVICSDLKYDCVLGCGISDDVSFEHELIHQLESVPCYLFDGTIEKLPCNRPEFTFIKKNIGALETPFSTNLGEYMKNYKSIFIKMDIEEGEYDWLEFLSENENLLDNVSQIVLEIHNLRNKMGTAKRLINLLNKRFHIIHVHGNNGAGGYATDALDDSIFFDVFEITFLTKDCFVKPEPSDEEIPSAIDMRNLFERSELFLYSYPFYERLVTKNNVTYSISPWNNMYNDKFEFNIVENQENTQKWLVISRFHDWGQNLHLRIENKNTGVNKIVQCGQSMNCTKLIELTF